MQISRRVLLLSGTALLFGCGGDKSPSPPSPPSPPPPPPPPPDEVTIDFSFATGLENWGAAYSEYRPGQEESIGFAFGHEPLPAELKGTSGFFLSGHNSSDDLFMYISRVVPGLAPNRNYRVEIEVAIATNAPPGCVGAGGAPGEGVTVKAGASPQEPANVADTQQNRVTVNFDKGDQSTGGAHAVVIGDLAQTEHGDCLNPTYRKKVLSTAGSGPTVSTDDGGRLWLVIGTDSGFESRTKLYYLEGSATLTPV